MLLKDYLKSKKITQVLFAKRIGVSTVYLNHIIKGRRYVGREMAKKIEFASNHHVSLLEILYPDDYIVHKGDCEQFVFPMCPCKKCNCNEKTPESIGKTGK